MTFDTTAVDNYMDQMNKRESEITRKMSVANLKQEAPATAMLWFGRLGAVALVILILGFAINKSLSWERININKTITEVIPESPINSKDVLIDIEEIMNKNPSFPKNVGSTKNPETIRNYYLFDKIPFNGEIIKEVDVGRIFDAPGKQSHTIYCYINWKLEGEFEKRLDLINIDEGKRKEKELTLEIADMSGISLEELQQAQKACNI
jgi:hypothetical protein